jgi:hypothetical protein
MVAGVKWKHIIGAILVTLLLKSRENCVNGHQTCSHVHPKYDEVSHTHIEPAHVMKKRSLDQSLRILLHYDLSVYR